MRRSALALALFSLVVVPAALAADVEARDFRYVRAVEAPTGGPVVIEPDGPLFAHARGGLVDLRVLDADGEQVAWRKLPPDEMLGAETIAILNRGRQGGAAVALLDLGLERRVHDRVQLEIPDSNFVGRVIVSGSDRRSGPFTRLSATGIYDVRGATRARSTTAVFPPTDFRYLQLRATNVTSIESALVSGAAQRPTYLDRTLRLLRTRQAGEQTIVTLDAGFQNVPVDELMVSAATARYDRPIVVEGSNNGRSFVPLVGARIFRFPGSATAPIAVEAHHRYLRLRIDNGDDEPLRGLRIQGRARSRAILVAGSQPRPYRLLYGNPGEFAPEYDFARLPRSALGLDRAREARLGAERPNPDFSTEEPERSFAEEHPRVVQLSLAVAGLVVAFAGFLAFRRRTDEST
jgi:hypothetical protein